MTDTNADTTVMSLQQADYPLSLKKPLVIAFPGAFPVFGLFAILVQVERVGLFAAHEEKGALLFPLLEHLQAFFFEDTVLKVY